MHQHNRLSPCVAASIQQEKMLCYVLQLPRFCPVPAPILRRRGGGRGRMADPACVAFLLPSIIWPFLPLCTPVRYFSLMVPAAGALQGVTCRCGDRNVREEGETSRSHRRRDRGGSCVFHFVSSAATCPRVSSPLFSFSCPQIPFSLWLICMQISHATQMRHAGGEGGRGEGKGQKEVGEDMKKSQGHGRIEAERKEEERTVACHLPGSKLSPRF